MTPTPYLDQYGQNSYMAFAGLRVVQSPLAETVKVTHKVCRHPIRKRRRNWTVVRLETRTPQAYMLGGHTLVIHPSLMQQLKEIKL